MARKRNSSNRQPSEPERTIPPLSWTPGAPGDAIPLPPTEPLPAPIEDPPLPPGEPYLVDGDDVDDESDPVEVEREEER